MPDDQASWKVGSHVQSQWDYTAGSSDEISAKENEPLVLVKPYDPQSPWLLVKRKSDGVEGYIPANYLEKVSSPPPQRPVPPPKPAGVTNLQPGSGRGSGIRGQPRKKRTLDSQRKFPAMAPPPSAGLNGSTDSSETPTLPARVTPTIQPRPQSNMRVTPMVPQKPKTASSTSSVGSPTSSRVNTLLRANTHSSLSQSMKQTPTPPGDFRTPHASSPMRPQSTMTAQPTWTKTPSQASGLKQSQTQFRREDLAHTSGTLSEHVSEDSILDNKDAIFHNLARWLADRPSVEQVSTHTGGVHVVTSSSNLKPKTKDSVTKTVFGMPLSEVYALGGGSSVPVVVIQCVDYLMGIGEANLEGVFRIPGNQQKILRLKEAYQTPKSKINLNGEDMHDVAGTLKYFFSELPEPIFPYDLYDEFVGIARMDEAEERIPLYVEALQKLPDLNGIIIRFFFEFLYQVSLCAEENMMTPANLGTCLGPSLLRPIKETTEQLMLAVEKDIVQQLVTDYNVLFDEVGMGTISKSLLRSEPEEEDGGKDADGKPKKRKLMQKVSSKRFTSNFTGKPAPEATGKPKDDIGNIHPPGKERPMSFHSVNLESSKKSRKFGKKK